MQLLLIPIIGAFIGWVTNVLAIRLIFWPYEPVRVPIINVHVQGLIPKRRAEIASKIGEIVENELLSADDFLAYLDDAGTQQKAAHSTTKVVRDSVVDRLPKYTPGYIKKLVARLVEATLEKELPGMLHKVSGEVGSEIRRHLMPKEIVEERINQLEVAALEQLILHVASKELGHIKIIGGILGFLIGLAQVGVILLFP